MDIRIVLAPELVVRSDGSVFHLHLKPEQFADRMVLVGNPARVTIVASYFNSQECEVSSRELHAITGQYKGKRITIMSRSIGTDNIDIVLDELDVLANIDFSTRTIKPGFKQLSLVRIGISGGLQPFVPIGAYVTAEKLIGFDGVIYFYANSSTVHDADLESELIKQLNRRLSGMRPYIISADPSLIKQVTRNDIIRGTTIAADGFYGSQGCEFRLSLTDSELNRKIEIFDYNGRKITNFEMESPSLTGLAALMGRQTMTVCYIIAGRTDSHINTDYKGSLEKLIEIVLDRV